MQMHQARRSGQVTGNPSTHSTSLQKKLVLSIEGCNYVANNWFGSVEDQKHSRGATSRPALYMDPEPQL